MEKQSWGQAVVPWKGLLGEWGQLKEGLCAGVQSGSVILEAWAGAETSSIFQQRGVYLLM